FSMDMVHPSPLSFMPVFDGKVIETTPYERLKNGNYNDVKILTGYNTDEGTLFVGKGISEADYENYVKIIFGDKASAVLERFPVDEAHTPTDRARQIVKMGFQIGCKTFGDAQSDNGKDVYVYNFDYHLPQMDEIGLGVMHAEELLFVFDTFPEAIELPEDGRKMIDQVHNYWVSFVKSGNPNGENGTEIWPKYTKEQQQILQINSNSKVIPLEEKEAVDFFTELMWEQ
ncbi:MAG: carboxylesterase family protein, partial [Eubacterium sp.]